MSPSDDPVKNALVLIRSACTVDHYKLVLI